MELSPAAAALAFVALGTLLLGLGAWAIAAGRAAFSWGWIPESLRPRAATSLANLGVSPSLPLVAWSPRRPVPWAAIDLLIVIGVYVLTSLAVGAVLRGTGGLGPGNGDDPSLDQHQVLFGSSALSLLLVFVGLPLIALRSGATLADFGWSRRELALDLRLGLIGFVMLAPPVYLLQGLLVKFWQPSKHPLMEMFKEAPSAGFFATLFVSAAVIAPLFEELMFRVVLQGFLEKAVRFRGDLRELVFDRSAAPIASPSTRPSERALEANLVADDPPASTRAAADDNPYAAPAVLSPFGEQQLLNDGGLNSIDAPELSGIQAVLPIAISSLVFALLHYSHGPDWIPLILLAAGMGYLYQRTHRLLPSLVVHAALNSLSMWGLWVSVQHGAAGG